GDRPASWIVMRLLPPHSRAAREVTMAYESATAPEERPVSSDFVDVACSAYTPSVTETLPTFPWNEGEGEEGWFEGIDLSFDTWKYDEHLPFDDAEMVW